MVDGCVPRAHFDRRDFRGLRESCGNDEHLILICHVAFMQKRLRHAQHKIGLPDLAALWKVGQPRVVGRIPFRHALIHPVADQLLFFCRQKAFASQRPVLVIRCPRGHVIRLRHVLNESPVFRNLCVRGERHGANFPCSVAFGALGVHNGRDVRVKRDCGLGQCRRRQQGCDTPGNAVLHGFKVPHPNDNCLISLARLGFMTNL